MDDNYNNEEWLRFTSIQSVAAYNVISFFKQFTGFNPSLIKSTVIKRGPQRNSPLWVELELKNGMRFETKSEYDNNGDLVYIYGWIVFEDETSIRTYAVIEQDEFGQNKTVVRQLPIPVDDVY